MRVRTVIILKGALLAEFHVTLVSVKCRIQRPKTLYCTTFSFQYDYEGVHRETTLLTPGLVA